MRTWWTRFCFRTVRVRCVNKWERVGGIEGLCVSSECESVLRGVPKRRWMSVGLKLTKCQESLFLGTLIPILVPKSVVHGVIPQLLMRFLGVVYEGCPESIQPLWISREPVAWPSCNLAASHRRPYCSGVNSHSAVGLVSRHWDAADWACVLCDSRIHNDRASRSANLHQCAGTFYRSRADFSFFGKTSHHPGLSAPPQPRFGSLRLLVFPPKLKVAVGIEEICECVGHTVYKPSQRRLTADWLAPRESDYSRMRSKVSSDCLPSYIRATRPILEIFKMAGYFTDRPRIIERENNFLLTFTGKFYTA